ncbi:MAG: hypothetical protein H0T87_08120 [Gammaproteobacteria bacterium]|nr:hypothetical protein [Gammaproteobacteria bacterium]
MTQTLRFKQSSHLDPALSDPATRTLNADKLIGRWVNTNSETQGIAEIVIQRDGEEFCVSAAGVGADCPIAWPPTRARVLANLEEEAGQRAVALAATFEFGFMTAETYLRINKGVLVIVLFSTFRDGSGRSNYVNREFYYRQQ